MVLSRAVGVLVLAAVGLAGCATTAATQGVRKDGSVVAVVAAENFWGSLASQLGGEHATVTSIINNPDADPHDYEPTAADGRTIAGAKIVIVNGVGYDAWAGKLVAAEGDAGHTLLDIGKTVGVSDGDNPHRWYNPGNVRQVIDTITADLEAADPGDAAYFDAQHEAVLGTALKTYFDTITKIKAAYGGTKVGASESIFAMLAPALGLDLITPSSFLTAISEGGDPTARDKSTIDAQITGKQIKVYVYNSQNATPDVQAQVDAAKVAGIPVSTITETLTPAGASFQDWQVAQLDQLQQALAQGM